MVFHQTYINEVHISYIYIHTRTHIYIYIYIYICICENLPHLHATYIYIYIYIYYYPQMVLLYHNSSVWLDMQNTSSWDWNPPNFMLDLISKHLTTLPAGDIYPLRNYNALCINLHLFTFCQTGYQSAQLFILKFKTYWTNFNFLDHVLLVITWLQLLLHNTI